MGEVPEEAGGHPLPGSAGDSTPFLRLRQPGGRVRAPVAGPGSLALSLDGSRRESRAVRLLIFHYHDRPGGVREVISRGLPLLLERLGGLREVVFFAGELGDPGWRAGLERSLGKIPLRWVVDPGWGYGGGNFDSLSQASSRKLVKLLNSPPAAGRTVLWAHNLSVGRNIPLLRALPDLCQAAGAELWLHHHDWWWDGRWARWEDWRASGVHSLEEALAATIPLGPHIQHRCVNPADLPFLQNTAGPAARWVGNPLPSLRNPSAAEVHAARQWLDARTGGRPVWLAPVRALRRKNLAESLLLTRCLAPGACLVTTGGALSPDEAPAWRKLREVAARNALPLLPQVLAGSGEPGGAGPGVAALMAASEAVVLTSLQEGFGLPWLEAAALGKPVISRRLPELEANLRASGCHVPGFYNDLPVPEFFYDRSAEDRRIWDRGEALLPVLPEELREEAQGIILREGAGEGESWPDSRRTMDFGRLTLDAQCEVLGGPLAELPFPQGLEPKFSSWPVEARGEQWAERFLSTEHAALPNALPGASSGLVSLRTEVSRRLVWWLRHPMVWPEPGGG